MLQVNNTQICLGYFLFRLIQVSRVIGKAHCDGCWLLVLADKQRFSADLT